MSFSFLGGRGVDSSMKRRSPVPFVLLLLAAGCGELSNADLVFLSAVPTAQELALEVSAPGQDVPAGLVGEPAEFYLAVYQVATDLNAAVGDILVFVDSLGRGHPPTRRTDDARVWGPVRNLDGKGITLRLEIRRTAREDGAIVFQHCLHMGRDAEVTGEEPSCNDRERGGLRLILGGSYQPSLPGGGARSGMGGVLLDFEASYELGVGKREDRGVLDITYDFTDGGAVAKLVQLVVVAPPRDELPAHEALYSYDRDEAGNVDFFLRFPHQAENTGAAIETMTITSCWQEGGAGRADVTVEGGDVAGPEPVSASECWDDQLLETYLEYTAPPNPAQSVGDVGLCPPPCRAR